MNEQLAAAGIHRRYHRERGQVRTMTEERKEELRRLADRLGYFGIESQACDAIKELLTENARLTARVAELEHKLDALENQHEDDMSWIGECTQ